MDSLYARYAGAMFALAEEEKKIEDYRLEFKKLKTVFLENEELIRLLSSYFLESEEKDGIIDRVFFDADPLTRNFLKVVSQNRRMDCIVRIIDEFVGRCDESLGILEGTVYSFRALDETEMARLSDALSARLNSRVELTNSVDPRLLGGVKIIVGDRIFDGSVKNKLEKMKDTLLSGGYNGD